MCGPAAASGAAGRDDPVGSGPSSQVGQQSARQLLVHRARSTFVFYEGRFTHPTGCRKYVAPTVSEKENLVSGSRSPA